ncbi:MAG: hypothetical protein R3322_00230 [Kiloniellales bacterium]|nr:hypothetical protein [Kiloniellales bacterium]
MADWLVDTGSACGLVQTSGDKVIATCPIYRWMRGKPWSRVQNWQRIKQIRPVPSHQLRLPV